LKRAGVLVAFASVATVAGDAESEAPAPSAVGASKPCAIAPACPTSPLDSGPRHEWRHPTSRAIAALGSAHHRARDLFQATDAPQWLTAKFAYGKVLKDLEDEDVGVWISRQCSGHWEKVGTTRTTVEGNHPPFDGVPVDAGRAFFLIDKSFGLGPGLHRARFVVGGDGTSAEALIEILPPGARFFVTDVDGTLSAGESIEAVSFLRGGVSPVHPDAARALRTLADKGYRPLYLSARPDWLTERTHQFLDFHGFPPGAVRLTIHDRGRAGAEAADFKSGELAKLRTQGLVPSFGFGNQPSDTVAYERAKINPATHRYFFGLGDTYGGRKIASYTDLLTEFGALSCP
jgi:hypothetical protein